MRFKEILREYSREKTANVFGKKLIAALLADRGRSYGGGGFHAILSDLRNRIDQKQKIGSPLDAEQTDLTAKQILHAIEQGDPTPNKEYVQWLAKCYANEGIKLEDIVSKGADWLKTYAQLKVKRLLPPNVTNIMNLKFEQLPDVVLDNELLNKLQSAEDKTADKGKATTVFENGAVRIIVPHDETSACYYGQGTRWCTAARSNNMFDRYNKDGKMYILLPKQPTYEGEKYQLHFPSGQYMDETDNAVNLQHLIGVRFSLVPFFKEREPEINNIVAFADDEVLASLLQRIGELVMDKANDMLSEWENSDNYYYQSLLDSGYGDEEGNIDWERVAEENVSYLNYDDGAREFYTNTEEAVYLTPDQARDYANELIEEVYDDGETLMLTDLDKIFIKSIDENVREDDGGASLKEFINYSIYITRDSLSGPLIVRDLRNK